MGANLFDTNSLIDLYKANENTIEGYTTIINLIEYPKAIDFFYKQIKRFISFGEGLRNFVIFIKGAL